MNRWLIHHLVLVFYILYFSCVAYVLYFGCSQHLFGTPPEGTDQRAMLDCAFNLLRGRIPEGHYRYSYSYTLFLSLLGCLSGGKLWLIRLLQLSVAAAIPSLIMRTARLFGWGRKPAALAALLYCGYAPALLISLDFLRAAPLALFFLLLVYFFALAWFKERISGKWTWWFYAFAGGCGAWCVLGRENFLAVVFLPLLFLIRRRNCAWWVYVTVLLLPLLAVLIFNGVCYGSIQLVPGNVGNILGFYGGREAAPAAAMIKLLAEVPAHLRDFCLSYELHNSLSVYAHREVIPLLRVFRVPFNLLLALGVAGAVLRRGDRGAQLCFLLGAAYVGSMLFFTVFYRFRIPVTPLLAVAAAGGFGSWMRMLRRGRRTAAMLTVGVVVLFCMLTAVNPATRRLESERAAVARVLIANDRLEEAECYLGEMAKDGFDPRPELRLLAGRLSAMGDHAAALRVISRYNALSKSY